MTGNQMTAELVPGADERALADTVRDVLTDLSPLSDVRADAEAEPGFGLRAWKALATDVGLCGLTVPESFGGLGLGYAAANVVHHELGRLLYPGPFLATSLAAAALCTDLEGAAAQRWLPLIASGEGVGAVALADRRGRWAGGEVTAAGGAGGWRLSGRRWFAVAAHAADVVLVLANTGTAGDSVFAVAADAPGCSVSAMTGLDLTRRLAVVELQNSPAVLVGAEGGAAAVLDAVGTYLRLALAAEAGGGLDWCLTTCVEYASTRQQFGRIIGSYQAVAHACVDLLAARRAVQAAARWAAVAAQNGDPEAALAGHVAALRGAEAYAEATEAGVHVLGGIGFTWEHDMHLFYRRARAAAPLAGGAAAHRRAIADLAGL
jgi:alkylation response protein AidB-like acyl-CoA dehydrogenase